MDDPGKMIVTLTVAELRELLHGTAKVLVAGMKEAVAEAVQGVLSIQTSQFRKDPPKGKPKEKPAPPSRLIGVKEVAQLLGACERTVWKLSSCGALPPPISIGRSRRWRRTDIESLIDEKAEEAEKERQRLARKSEGAD